MTFREDSPKIDPKYLFKMSDNESSVGQPDQAGCLNYYDSEDLSDIDTNPLRPGVTTRSQAGRRSRSAPSSRPGSRSAKSRSSSRTRLPRPNSSNDQHTDPQFRPVSPDRHTVRSHTPPRGSTQHYYQNQTLAKTKEYRPDCRLSYDLPRESEDKPLNSTD